MTKRIDFFNVKSAQITVKGESTAIPKKRAILVNGNTVNITSDKYAIHQPADIYKAFERVCSKTKLEINPEKTMLNPKTGGMILSAKYATKMFDAGTKKEAHDINVVFYTSHDGKYRTFMTLDVLRILCMNQAPALYKGKDKHIMSEKHYQNALKLSTLESRLEGIEESVRMYKARSEQLCDVKLTLADFTEFYIGHYGLNRDSSHFDGKINALHDVYNGAKGQASIANDTAYKAYNAITYINTHNLSATDGKDENRLHTKTKDTAQVMGKLLALAA